MRDHSVTISFAYRNAPLTDQRLSETLPWKTSTISRAISNRLIQDNFGSTMARGKGSEDGEEIMVEPMQMCPMAETCKGMMEKPGSSLWMIAPGIIFIVLGVAIIVYPQILAWIVAIAMIVMGVGMLIMVNFMRGIGRKFGNSPY